MTEFEKYIQRYLDLVPSENWIQDLKNVGDETLGIYHQLSEDEGNFAYAPEKWTLKNLLQHLIDTEKIFGYRALRFARKDQTELAGYDEDLFATNDCIDTKKLNHLLFEFDCNRQASLLFFGPLNADQLKQKGIANGNEISVETIGKLLVGHNIHHLNIIKERYLPLLKA